MSEAIEPLPGQLSLFDQPNRIKSLGAEGILDESDLPKLRAACQRILDLMLDEKWHDAEEIRQAAGTNGTPASEGLRRMRELRKAGYTIERRKAQGMLFEYRLSK